MIEDDKIKKVGPHISFQPGKNDRVIDASGCWVMPGLIEAHCHLGISEEKKGFEGNDCNEITEPVTPDEKHSMLSIRWTRHFTMQ